MAEESSTSSNRTIEGTLDVTGAVTLASTLACGQITQLSVALPVYQVHAIGPWYFADTIASQTDLDLKLLGGTVPVAVTLGRAGSVRAVIAQVESAQSAGTLTVQATIAGTPDTDSNAVISTAVSYVRTDIAHGAVPFTASQSVGVSITTDGDWAAGTTPELYVWLLVDYDVAI